MSAVTLLTLSAISCGAATDAKIYHFTAPWCGPCQQMAPLVSRLCREGVPIRKIDVDQERALSQQFHVQSIPSFVLVVNGKEVTRIVGATSEQELRRLFARIPAEQNRPAAVTPSNSPDDKVGHLCRQLEEELRKREQAGDKEDQLRRAVEQYLDPNAKSCWIRATDPTIDLVETQTVAKNLQAALTIQVRRPPTDEADVDRTDERKRQDLASRFRE